MTVLLPGDPRQLLTPEGRADLAAAWPDLHLLVREAVLAQLDGLAAVARKPWSPHPHQIPPPLDEDWFGWLLFGGRGAGKTAACTHWLDDHAKGPPCFPGPIPHRMGIIAPTLGDASASIVNGVDGLAVINPGVREVTRKGGTVVLWPNGAMAMLFGTYTEKDVDRLRAGGNRCADLREEIAAWPRLREGLAQADFGLRAGIARWVGATTPKPRPSIRALNAKPTVRVSRATTADNPDLPERVRQGLYEEYEHTRIGQQELEGIILEDVTGALWTQELIEANRVTPDMVPELRYVRTYVDPSWGTTNDECGIVVAGFGVNGHVYVLADLSKRTTPAEWGIISALGWLPPKGDWTTAEARLFLGEPSRYVAGEKAFQGEQVKMVMRLTAQAIQRRVPFRLLNSHQSKKVRAEPVMWLYEQGRVHHVNTFPGLEFQLTSWVPPEAGSDAGDPGDPPQQAEGAAVPSDWSPDRLDALVFAVWDLALSARGMAAQRRGVTATDDLIATPEGDLIATAGRAIREVPGDRETPVRRPRVGRVPTIPRQV